MRPILLNFTQVIYKRLTKPLFFMFDPEMVHTKITTMGERMGNISLVSSVMKPLFRCEDKVLQQEIEGIYFDNPIGLAAGFDYDAKLTQILHPLGFGFQTVGTITNNAYEGNKGPMLGRLPRSQSLMVNKGFKNEGAEKMADKLKQLHFQIPLGISIGRTNTLNLKNEKESIIDIVNAFEKFEKAQVSNAYYELNISCPNLKGNISFYPPHKLRLLLREVEKLHLSKPLFIKMPIEKSNKDVLDMLEVITQYNVTGVIFGNLQKNRHDQSLDVGEVRKFNVGNFSGKPTWQRSNELIQLTYQTYGKELVIIGCGGVFSGRDAYTKIKMGASLVQLITGLIFEGPQLVSQINHDLVKFMKADGFTHIAEARGSMK